MSTQHRRGPQHDRSGTGATGVIPRHSYDVRRTRDEGSPLYGGQLDTEGIWQPDLTAGIVDGGTHIFPGSVPVAAFASTIRPPTVESSLPTLPDDEYPEGSLVFLTTDGKLWRNVSDVWTVAVDGADIIADSITAGQIAAGAIGTTELAADAVIANVANVGGTVTIDSTGITILDGSLTLEDYTGESSLDAYGFGGAWLGFLADGIYNSSFDYGVTGTDLTHNNTVPNTTALYKSTLSTQLPGWHILKGTSAARVRLMSDVDALGGFALRFDNPLGDATNRQASVFQDIPVLPGDELAVEVRWRYGATGAGNEITRNVVYYYCDADHAPLTSVSSDGEIFSGSAGFATDLISVPDVVPNKARFLRLSLGFGAKGVGAALIDSVRLKRTNLTGLSVVEAQSSLSGIQIDTDSIIFGAGADDWTGPTFQRASLTLLDLTSGLRLGGGLYWDLSGSSGESAIFPWLNGGEWTLDIDPFVGAADTDKMTFLRGKLWVTGTSTFAGNVTLSGTSTLTLNDSAITRAAASFLSTGTNTAFRALGGFVQKVKAGVPVDGDIPLAVSGATVLDTTNNRIYFRVGSTWRYATLT